MVGGMDNNLRGISTMTQTQEIMKKFEQEFATSKEIAENVKNRLYSGKEKWLNIHYVKEIIRMLKGDTNE